MKNINKTILLIIFTFYSSFYGIAHSQLYTIKFDDSTYDAKYFILPKLKEYEILKALRTYKDKIEINSQFVTWDFKFIGNADFHDITFKKEVSMIGGTFEDVAYFAKGTFYELANFNNNTFKGIANFSNVSFNKAALFGFGIFYNDARFVEDTFKGHIDFHLTHFHQFVNFNRSVFLKKATFDNIIIGDSAKLIFQETVLPDTISFYNNPIIGNEIDLSVANFKDISHYDSINDRYKKGKWHYINLYKSNVAKFHIDYSHFRLLLTDPETGKLLPSDEAKSMYEALLKNFKDRGQIDSYKLLDIEYQEYLDNSYKKWISKLDKWWWNFGYNKEYVFYWVFWSLFIFTVINFFAFNWLQVKVYSVGKMPIYQKRYNGARLWYAFVYTAIVFFSLTLKIDNIKFKNKGGTLYIMFIYTLGLICIAYMANFVLQK